MEDILNIYEMPYNPAVPAVYRDEKPYQLLEETREPLPMRPGDTPKVDLEYIRNGTCTDGLMSRHRCGVWYIMEYNTKHRLAYAMMKIIYCILAYVPWGKLKMGRLKSGKFEQEYNKSCGGILKRERIKRNISRERLGQGIMSEMALGNIEDEKAGWSKVIGDTLLQRMGVAADYFEVVASSGELDRWRMREDICMLMPICQDEALMKVQEYREKYEKRTSVENQFLKKVEVLARFAGGGREKSSGNCFQDALSKICPEEGEHIMKMACEAVSCTILKGWQRNLDSLWLSPGELEALLLVAAAQAICGREEEAWKLQQAVWNYPHRHGWEERIEVMVLPQAALLGMELACRDGENHKAFFFGREALELLRRTCSHCYALALLEKLCSIPVQDVGEREYLERAESFCRMFKEIYRQYGYPGYRLWQGITVENTRDVGQTLMMLRKFAGKSRAQALYDGTEMVVTERQLEKIEKGTHKPSHNNYNRLIKQYKKTTGWKTVILETDSVEVLEFRQRISTLIGFREWEKAETEINKFRRKVDTKYPRVRQELLRFDALLKWKKEKELEKSLEMMLEALHYTVPNEEGKEMKWWVFQREEIMIASNIATLYRKIGRIEEAKKWTGAVKFSLEAQRARTGIIHTGYGVLMESYDNLLGEMGCFEEALKVHIEVVHNYINTSNIFCSSSAYYRIAWNSYEIARENKHESAALRERWRTAFQISELLADYINDKKFQAFLKERRGKYLN